MGAQCGQGRLEQGRCGPRPVRSVEQGRWNGVAGAGRGLQVTLMTSGRATRYRGRVLL